MLVIACIQKNFLKRILNLKVIVYYIFISLFKKYNADFSFQAAFVGRFIDMYYFYRKYHKASIFYSISKQIIHILSNTYEILKNFTLIKNIIILKMNIKLSKQ